MATAPPIKAKGGGNILTRKFGPLHGWAWAAVGVAGYMVYKQRKAASAAAAAAAPATTATGASSPAAGAPSGYGYQGPSGGGGPGWNVGQPTGATGGAAAATPWSAPTDEVYGGAGYGSKSGAGVVTSAAGNQFAEMMPGSTVAGQQYYYQPSPGVFNPIPGGGGPGAPGIAGAPYYQMVSGSS